MALAALTAPAAAQVIVCQTKWSDAGCYLKQTVQPAFRAEIPDAQLTETTRLYATYTGQPAAKVSWAYAVPQTRAAAVDRILARPQGAIHRITGSFAFDLQHIVCGVNGVYGTLDSAGQFVKSGGVVTYSLSIPHAELASVTIHSCEAP